MWWTRLLVGVAWTNNLLTPGVSQLALAGTDGSVLTLAVKRIAVQSDGQAPTWKLELGEPSVISPADRRTITAIKWLTVGPCYELI